jgi:hypothetical protein
LEPLGQTVIESLLDVVLLRKHKQYTWSVMRILVIDAQGGGIGKQLVFALKKSFPDSIITAVGTNSAATSAMLKAGADNAATGENAVIVGCRKTDIIVGPIGIVISDSLYGEITPSMAIAVGRSEAKRILVPINHCDNVVVGVKNLNISSLIADVIDKVREVCF